MLFAAERGQKFFELDARVSLVDSIVVNSRSCKGLVIFLVFFPPFWGSFTGD